MTHRAAYYNEFDPYAAQWLRNLIAAGHIAPGDVDERSITDVAPDDLAGYRQCHFFAGIAGWGLAARIAGWPDDRELWTGSAPCQPFSVAGAQRGTDDERHLWPHLFRLTRARRPAVLMGEQVAAAVGAHWLDGVFADLEGIGYACGAAVVPAAAVDAPHRRDRLWFVAHAQYGRCEAVGRPEAMGAAAGRESVTRDQSAVRPDPGGRAVAMADSDGVACGQGREIDGGSYQGGGAQPWAGLGRSGSGSAWGNHAWIIGHDGKARRVEPGIRLLAHGIPARVGRLRAYGNAICVPLAAEIVAAYMDCRP